MHKLVKGAKYFSPSIDSSMSMSMFNSFASSGSRSMIPPSGTSSVTALRGSCLLHCCELFLSLCAVVFADRLTFSLSVLPKENPLITIDLLGVVLCPR